MDRPLGSRTRLFLVGLSDGPRLLSTYSVDGQLLEATEVGSTVRMVTQTYPGIVPAIYLHGDSVRLALVLDLSDPARPQLTGRLPLTAADAVSLYQASATRQIVVATGDPQTGKTDGVRVSLYDVAKPGTETLLGTCAVARMNAQNGDQPSFLYSPGAGLILLHVWETGEYSRSLYLALHVTGTQMTSATLLSPPAQSSGAQIQRSLITGSTLWTVWPGGLMESDLATLRQEAWPGFA